MADAVVVLHVAFVLFAVAGGLLALRWRWIPWIHLPALAWAAFVELTGRICPLTPLENRLRAAAGAATYRGDFVEHYLLPVLYPEHLTRDVQFTLASILILFNLAVYAMVWRSRPAEASRSVTSGGRPAEVSRSGGSAGPSIRWRMVTLLAGAVVGAMPFAVLLLGLGRAPILAGACGVGLLAGALAPRALAAWLGGVAAGLLGAWGLFVVLLGSDWRLLVYVLVVWALSLPFYVGLVAGLIMATVQDTRW